MRRRRSGPAAQRVREPRPSARPARPPGTQTDGGPKPPQEPPAAQPGVGDALAGVARTGVAVASGTVGLGLKAAGGALAALRGTIERR